MTQLSRTTAAALVLVALAVWPLAGTLAAQDIHVLTAQNRQSPPPPPPDGQGPRRDNPPPGQGQGFTIDNTLSGHAQETTIAFSALAFLTGNFCADTFIPPGKVADFFGFQYLRDNDPDHMGHNTDFLTRAADNVLFVLGPDQIEELKTLARTQASQVDDYAYGRFPLLAAVRRAQAGDLPPGTRGLSLAAFKSSSAELYRLDGRISLERTEVLARIIRALTPEQSAYLQRMAQGGMHSWPEVGEQVDRRSMNRSEHVLVMTYASQLYSWFAGSVEADTYFCPERQANGFGAFYMKGAPAMGNPDYTIDSALTGDKGAAFLALLDPDQRETITSLVDGQREILLEIVATREAVSQELRKALSGEAVDQEQVLHLAARYGELDGVLVYRCATAFIAVGETLSAEQQAEFAELRGSDCSACTGAYLYSDPISSHAAYERMDTDEFFE